MSTISRLVGALSKDAREEPAEPSAAEANLDGALDTVSGMLRVVGAHSFSIDDEVAARRGLPADEFVPKGLLNAYNERKKAPAEAAAGEAS